MRRYPDDTVHDWRVDQSRMPPKYTCTRCGCSRSFHEGKGMVVYTFTRNGVVFHVNGEPQCTTA